jgi:hypothetical protein
VKLQPKGSTTTKNHKRRRYTCFFQCPVDIQRNLRVGLVYMLHLSLGLTNSWQRNRIAIADCFGTSSYPKAMQPEVGAD